jgi:hypothetical protein
MGTDLCAAAQGTRRPSKRDGVLSSAIRVSHCGLALALVNNREMEMYTTHRRLTVCSLLLCTAISLEACGGKSSASAGPEHIRGTIQSLDGDVLMLTTSTGSARVQLAKSTRFATVVQSDRAHIAHGSFVGIASATQPDGSQRAVEVTVFPESMRGTGEGSYGWDVPGVEGDGKMTNGTAASSKMTNGTVSRSKMTNGTVAAREGGSSLTLHYKDGASDGSQRITVPPGIPVVALEPGQSGDLQPGLHVFVVASRDTKGVLTADRVVAGKNGVVPPM